MQILKKSLFISSLVFALTLVSCNTKADVFAYEYKHQYDNLKISEIKSQKSLYTYSDFAQNHLYTSIRYPFSYSPSTGNVKFLIIPVWFNDSSDYIAQTSRENVRSDIEKVYLGEPEDTGWESVKSYYEKDSFGNLHIDGVVTEWYETGDASSNYYSNSNATGNLLVKAVKWAKETYGNMTDFDQDKDGFLDSVILIYAAPEQSNLNHLYGNGNYGNMWAYTNFMLDQSKKRISNPGPNTFFWASYDFMYSYGEDAYSHSGKSSCGIGDTTVASLDAHTFIHETGHLFGLPDYYDYGGGMSPSLGFSMQDMNVGAHDPYSRFALGWAEAIVPTKTSKIHLEPMESSGKFVLLSNSYHKSAFDEYFAIELYTPTGLNKFDSENTYRHAYPTGPSKAGIRIWHVDSRLYSVQSMDIYMNITKGKVTYNPNDGAILAATNNNSTYNGGAVDYAGSIQYNQLQVVRSNYLTVDKNGDYVNPEQGSRYYFDLIQKDLFDTGDYFTMEQYRLQFINLDKLNSKKRFPWAIYIDEVNDDGATITVIKR